MQACLIHLAIFWAIGFHFTLAFRPFRRSALTSHGLQQPDYFTSPASDGLNDALSDAMNNAQGESKGPIAGNGTFDQYIDHNNHSLGMFKQRFLYNATFWNGAGSPVLVLSPGFHRLEDWIYYLTPLAIQSTIAEKIGAAILIVEFRYFGESLPFAEFTTKNLQYLTPHQIIADWTRISTHLKLPFDSSINGSTSGSSNRPHAPWIFSDAQESATLGVWTQKAAPETFWVVHASGASTEAVLEYPQFSLAIRKGMPANCSNDFAAIISHVDDILQHGNDTQKADLKAQFGLQTLEYSDDVAYAISLPIVDWQNVQFYTGYTSFFQMCDWIEGYPQEVSQSSSGVGLERALPNYAKWFKEEYIPYQCPEVGYPEWNNSGNVDCFATHNASSPYFTDISGIAVESGDRAQNWALCNWPFFGYGYLFGLSCDQSRVFSCLIQLEYYYRQCHIYFPPEGTYTFNHGDDPKTAVAKLNDWTGGWSFTGTERFLWVDGGLDPWRDLGVRSDLRPGGPYNGTKENPSIYYEYGVKAFDQPTANGDARPEVAAIQKGIVNQISEWTKEFYHGSH